MKGERGVFRVLELRGSAPLRDPLFVDHEVSRRSLHKFFIRFSGINCFSYLREGDWGKMKRVFSVVMVGLLCLSMFSIFAPKAKTDSAYRAPAWEKYPGNPVLDTAPSGSWDDLSVWAPAVVWKDNLYRMWYCGGRNDQYIRIGLATSSDGVSWARYGTSPVLDVGPSGWDSFQVNSPSVVFDGSKYCMWYSGNNGYGLGLATSSDGVSWTKYSGNPVFSGGRYVSVIFDGSIYKMWYEGYDYTIRYATSSDGISWTEYSGNPVLTPGPSGSWDGMYVSAPSVVFDGSQYIMSYTGYHDSIFSRKIGLAYSPDGITWSKDPNNPVIDVGTTGAWDSTFVDHSSMLLVGSSLKMWYSGFDGTNSVSSPTYYHRIGLASATGTHGPVGYWKFDEGSGNIAQDSSGNGNFGSVNDATWMNGVVGQALHFDGIDDWVSIPTSPTLEITGNQITFEFWVKFDNAITGSSPYMKFFDKGDAYNSAMRETGNIRFTFWLAGDSSANLDSSRTSWLAGTWYHIAEVYDGNAMSIYVNGILDNSMPMTGNIASMSYPLAVGAYTLGGQYFLQGAMDEFKIYNYARTTQDILNDYNSVPQGPVGNWKFDEGSGNIAHDSSGNGNDGTLVSGPQWVAGVSGSALSFDGQSSYVNIPDSQSLRPVGNQLSVEFWFKPTITLDSSTPASLFIDKGNSYAFWINMAPQQPVPNGKIGFIVSVDSPYYNGYWVETTTSQWLAGSWYHIVGTYDGSFLKIYVNGVLENSMALAGTYLTSDSYPLAIGAYDMAAGWRPWFFNGAIDEVRIYNYARTAQEIQNDYISVQKPDFEISVSPGTQIGQPDSSVYYQVNVKLINGFSSSINLVASFSPYPGHIGWDFGPNLVTPPPDTVVPVTFKVNIYSDTPLDTFTITIAASSGVSTKTVVCTLQIERMLDVPYQNEGYSSWCVASSLAMTLRYFGKDFHSWDYASSANLPTDQGGYIDDLKTYIDNNFSPEITAKIGYYLLPFGGDNEAILSDIRSNITIGYPVIIQLGPTLIVGHGHAVVAVGFNDTGLFVNDPSGALFTDPNYLNLKSSDPKYPKSWIHAYVEWSDIARFIRTSPLASILAVQGIPNPSDNLGSLYVTSNIGIVFIHPNDDQNNGLTQDYYSLYLDKGLEWMHNYTDGQTWTIGQDNIISSDCSRLFVFLGAANSASQTLSFTFHVDILGPQGVIYSIGPRPINDLQGISEDKDGRASGGIMDVSSLLTKGIQYQLEFYLCDSSNKIVDHFTSEPFYWAQGTEARLSESQQHLYLHAYDSLGDHVGLNYTTNHIDLNIPGSYYSDDSNGTIIIVIPQTMNLTIVVDARFAEDPIESYNLTVISQTDLGSSVQTYSGTIAQGMADTHHLYVPPNETPIIDDAPPSTQMTIGNPKYVTSTVTYITKGTPFTLQTNDGAGSGVGQTAYRVANSSYDTGWILYTKPFKLAGFGDGNYVLSFNSTDNAGNVEKTNTVTVVVDNTAPSTNISIGIPNYVTSSSTFVTSETCFTLSANDNFGSGVAASFYEIYNSTYNSGWLTYKGSLCLTKLAVGNYTFAYYSVDNVGNQESVHSVKMSLFSWTYAFNDYCGRKTTLKINVDYKLFWFTAPGKDFGVKRDPGMNKIFDILIICYNDKAMSLDAMVTVKLNFCAAIAFDKQTYKTYLLINKPYPCWLGRLPDS